MNNNPKVNRVFSFIVKYKKSHDGNSPTIREIGSACGVSSTSVVNYYLNKLEEDGLIRRDNFQSRNIDVVGGSWVYTR